MENIVFIVLEHSEDKYPVLKAYSSYKKAYESIKGNNYSIITLDIDLPNEDPPVVEIKFIEDMEKEN